MEFKSQPFDPDQISDTELVDLAHVPSPVPSETGVPREYRKLQDLHAKAPGDTSVRLLAKKKPQFSYSNGEDPELPFLQKGQDIQGSFDPFESSRPEDVKESEPSGSLHDDMGIFDQAFFERTPGLDDDPSPASFQESYLINHEAGIMNLRPPSAPVNRTTAFKSEDSFTMGGFDFAAYENMGDSNQTQSRLEAEGNTKEEPRSSSSPHNPTKRSLPTYEIEPEVKHRRLDSSETATRLSQLPEWTDEIDRDIIESLRYSIDFV